MKHFISILFILFAISITLAKGGGGHGGGHSSHSHSSSHSSHSSGGSHSFGSHTGGHTTTHHISKGTPKVTTNSTGRCYKTITYIHPSEIHMYSTSGSRPPFLYYYLLFNHNTQVNDTIQSNTKEDLEQQVQEISSEGDLESSAMLGLLGIVVVIAICIVLVLWNRN